VKDCAITVNFDSECCIPPDPPHHGEVTCQVVRSHCQIINCWKEWATFEVRLLLKQTIHSGRGPQCFTKEVTVRESVMLDPCLAIRSCRVVAAICRCVLNRGQLHCNGTVRVEFSLSPKHGCGDPCHHRQSGIREESLRMSCWHDDWDCKKDRHRKKCHDWDWDCDRDWDDDWKRNCHDWKRHCDDDWKRLDCDHEKKKRCCDDDRKHDWDDDWKRRDCDHDKKKRFCDDDWDDDCRRDRCDKKHDDDKKFCRCDDHKNDRDFCKFCGRPKRHSCKKDDRDFFDCDRKKSKRSFQQVIVHGDHGKNKRFIFG